MNSKEFLLWLDGFYASMRTIKNTNPYVEKIMEVRNEVEDDPVMIPSVWRTYENTDIDEYEYTYSNKCSKCGLDLTDATGYVCNHPECPCGLGPTMVDTIT